MSRKIQPLVDQVRGDIVDSSVCRRKNQYRLYAQGTTTTLVVVGTRMPEGMRWSRMSYDFVTACVANGEISGEERTFCGATDGLVYEVDYGNTFLEAAITGVIRLPFNSLGSPRVRKRFRRVWADVKSEGDSFNAMVSAEFDYSDPDSRSGIKVTGEVTQAVDAAGGFWTLDEWSDFVWSGRQVGEVEASLAGSGYNIALILRIDGSGSTASHVWESVTIKYTSRAVGR